MNKNMEISELNKAKSFYKNFLKLNPRYKVNKYLSIAIAAFLGGYLATIIPYTKQFHFGSLGFVFRGMIILLCTYLYMNSITYSFKVSIYEKLKYCPIERRYLDKIRNRYFVKFVIEIFIVFVGSECIAGYMDIKSINIISIFNPVAVVLSFVLLPGIIYFILEKIRHRKFLKCKRNGVITILILFISSYAISTYFLDLVFNIEVNTLGLEVVLKSEDRYFDKSTWSYYKSDEFLPKIEDLPKYEDIFHQYVETQVLFFMTESRCLVVKYDEETYQKEKSKLGDKYVFLDRKIGTDGNYTMPQPRFSIGSYDFRVVKTYNGIKSEFPKYFGMIGTSDDEKRIAYLYYYDQDLDYISEEDDKSTMAEFVKNYFRYDF